MNRSLILTSAAAGLCLFVGLDLLYTHDQFVIGVILVVIGLANLVRMTQLLGIEKDKMNIRKLAYSLAIAILSYE